MTKPDSDAHEVKVPAEIRPCLHMTVRHRIGMPPELWCETCGMWRAVERPTDDVSLPLSLAQRILAALEGTYLGDWHTERRAIIAELRAVIGK